MISHKNISKIFFILALVVIGLALVMTSVFAQSNPTAPVNTQTSQVSGQSEYTVVNWDLKQYQDNLGQYVYNLDATAWFVNKPLPTGAGFVLADTPSFASGVAGNNYVALEYFPVASVGQNSAGPYDFYEIYDPALDTNTFFQLGQQYYVGFFPDGTSVNNDLVSFQRMSAYGQPNVGVNVQWNDPYIRKDAQTGKPYIVLQTEITPLSANNDTFSLGLGTSWTNQVIVDQYTSIGSGLTTFLSFFDTYTDIATGQTYPVLPDQTYFSVLYQNNIPIAGMKLGSFISDTTTLTGEITTTNGNGSATISGEIGGSGSGVGGATGGAGNIGTVAIGSTDIPVPGINEINYSFSENGIVPCGGPGEEECEFKHFIKVIENGLNFIFILIVPLAAIAFTYAGILYMTGGASPDKRKKANGIFLNVVIGIVVILAAWLIVVSV
jgi:hypothetical protein